MIKPCVFLLLLQQNWVSPCKTREYGDGNIVCVCDDTYCDTIPSVEKVPRPRFLHYSSNKAGLRLHRASGLLRSYFLSRSCDILLNPTEKYQRIIGWGGAFTDSTGINVLSLNRASQDRLLQSYFGPTGLEYNLGRVPIAGTDFSTHGYTYDDQEEPDPELKNFTLQREDYRYKIPLIFRAMQLRQNRPLQLFASPWGAPAWLKTNHNTSGYGLIDKQYYRVWAEYFVKFLQEYKNNGLEFWAVTTQNEPSLAFAGVKDIMSIGWLSTDLSDWIRNDLGPLLKTNFPNVSIMILDDQKPLLPWYTNSVLDDKETRSFVAGIAIHWYFGALTPCTAMVQTHNLFPNIFILSTEASNGFQRSDGVSLGSWERGEQYSTDIIEDMNCWVTGWVDWNMALNPAGGPTYINNYIDSPIVVNSTSNEFYKQPMYYHLAHHTKFVPAGSIRIGATYNLPVNITAAAFQRPDGGTVVVILNTGHLDKEVRIADGKVEAEVTITGRSINTIIYW